MNIHATSFRVCSRVCRAARPLTQTDQIWKAARAGSVGGVLHTGEMVLYDVCVCSCVIFCVGVHCS